MSVPISHISSHVYDVNPKATMKIAKRRITENKAMKEIKRNHKNYSGKSTGVGKRGKGKSEPRTGMTIANTHYACWTTSQPLLKAIFVD